MTSIVEIAENLKVPIAKVKRLSFVNTCMERIIRAIGVKIGKSVPLVTVCHDSMSFLMPTE